MKLKFIHIDKHSTVALHQQLYRSLKSAIQSGTLKPGDRCPTEIELVRRFEISRPVIQQAYTQLLDERLIIRRKGLGTFVSQKPIDFNLIQNLLPMTKMIEANGWNPTIVPKRSEILHYSEELMGNLHLTATDKVMAKTRVYLADNVPLVYFTQYLPLKYYPNVDAIDMSHEPIITALERNYPHRIKRAFRTIYAVILNDDVCSVLNLSKNSAGFQINNVSYSEEGVPLQSSTHYLKGEGTNMTVDYYRNYVKDLDIDESK